MYVLINKQCQFWNGTEWDSDIGEAERYNTEEESDEEAFTILEEWGIAAHAIDTDELPDELPDEDE